MLQNRGLIFLLGIVSCWTNPLRSQEVATIEAKAYTGKPLGVGSVRLQFRGGRFVSSDPKFRITESSGRALYPVFATGSTTPTEILSSGYTKVGWIEAYFLVEDDTPLTASLKFDGHSYEFTVKPVAVSAAESARKELLERWWFNYQSHATNVTRTREYLPLVENYASAMLARRLGLPYPEEAQPYKEVLLQDLMLIFTGADEIRLALQKDRLLEQTQQSEPANLPMPAPVLPPPITIPPFEVPAVESLARHVPAESFYIRLRNVENYQWFRALLDRMGGGIRDLSTARSVDFRTTERLQRQLAINEQALTHALGHQILKDLGVVGFDPLVHHGAALGLLLEAKNSELLKGAILTQRALVLTTGANVRETHETIAGHEVSLLSTSDQQVRSFYAVDGNFHLVTTSRTLVRRFFEAGAGNEPLAQEQEFLYARSKTPHDRPDNVFLYFSDKFFRQFVGPHFRIEMTRRMQADADLELAELAKMAARMEMSRETSLSESIKQGFLPANFLQRPDGTSTQEVSTGFKDSLRGARRTFVPIADVEVPAATATEVKAYAEFARYYRNLYTRMDPVVISISRSTVAKNVERIVGDISITPYTQQNLGMLRNLLAPATKAELVPVAGDLIYIDANIKTHFLATGGEPTTVRAALRDRTPPSIVIVGGKVQTEAVSFPNNTPVYFVASPGRSFMQIAGIREHAQDADNEGFWQTTFQLGPKLWCLLKNETLSVSPFKEILKDVTPQLKFAEAVRPAQVRVRVAELASSQFAPYFRAYDYLQMRTASEANTRFFESLSQQLRVPDQEVRKSAELILDALPRCPLGGQYRLEKNHGTTDFSWRSTSWPEGSRSLRDVNAIPANFRSELLNWFGGLTIEATLDLQTLTTHFELDLKQSP